MALQRPDPHALDENSRILELLKGREPIKEKRGLPKIKDNNVSVSKVESTDRKVINQTPARRKSKSVNGKMSLDSIFQDRNEFIKNYFDEINCKVGR